MSLHTCHVLPGLLPVLYFVFGLHLVFCLSAFIPAFCFGFSVLFVLKFAFCSVSWLPLCVLHFSPLLQKYEPADDEETRYENTQRKRVESDTRGD